MISAQYCRLMARYTLWQNRSLITAADGLTDAARHLDRGAFFKSIAATFNHLYWADALVLARINGNERPQDEITHSLTAPSDWSTFKTLRQKRDTEIAEWAARLTDEDLTGMARWYAPGATALVEMPMAVCAVELFTHQTHHRGQIHAMLTHAGARPGPTDLSVMPQEART